MENSLGYKFYKNRKLFFIGFFILIFCFFFFVGSIGPKKLGDNVFNTEALRLATYILGNKSIEIQFSHAIVPALYYTIPALINEVFSLDMFYEISIILNLVLISFSLYFLYCIAFKILESYNFAGLFLILFLTVPSFIYYSYGILSEPPGFFLMTLFLYYSSEYNIKRRKIDLFCSSLFLGLFISCRPNLMVVIPLVIFISILIKKYRIGLIGVYSFLIFISISAIAKLATENKNDKTAFLIEQIRFGQFFMRYEPTDWSFFNGEYRPNSVDYDSLCSSSDRVTLDIKKGIDPVDAQLKELKHILLVEPLITLKLFFFKFIHGNSYHIGSRIPGKLSVEYFKKYYLIFITNILINLINWFSIIITFYVLIFHFREFISKYWFLILIPISLMVFNSIAASEQRYMMFSKPFLLIITLLYFRRYSNTKI
jgi:hypothetical protein